MVTKDSSEVLNTTDPLQLPLNDGRATSGKDFLALAIATCGVGYSPIAPGTFGSLVGVGLYAVAHATFLSFVYSIHSAHKLDALNTQYLLSMMELFVVVLISLLGVWAGSHVEKLSARKDPGKVVIDEVAGQYLALTAIPVSRNSWGLMLLAFLLFRFFDIVKPYPARRFESLTGGLGIMADDIMAGAYAALCIGVVVATQSLF